jgi:hypothetical protein
MYSWRYLGHRAVERSLFFCIQFKLGHYFFQVINRGKALSIAVALAIFCGVCFVLSIIWSLHFCQGTFLIVGVTFGLIAYNKYRRDAKIIAESHRAEIMASRQPQLPPAITSPGSSRMFVPPPLQRHKRS